MAVFLPGANRCTFSTPVVTDTRLWRQLMLTAFEWMQKHNDYDFDCYSSFTIFSRTGCFSHIHKAGSCVTFL